MRQLERREHDTRLRRVAAAGACALLVLTGCGVVERTLASSEMFKLRDIEQGLSLPNNIGRSEDDRGDYLDDGFEQSRHFRRVIMLEYGNREILDSIGQQLPGKGWQLVPEIIEDYNLNRYINLGNMTCINTLDVTGPDYDTGMTRQYFSLSIMDAKDERCRL